MTRKEIKFINFKHSLLLFIKFAHFQALKAGTLWLDAPHKRLASILMHFGYRDSLLDHCCELVLGVCKLLALYFTNLGERLYFYLQLVAFKCLMS
jgi:hypothetical protein